MESAPAKRMAIMNNINKNIKLTACTFKALKCLNKIRTIIICISLGIFAVEIISGIRSFKH